MEDEDKTALEERLAQTQQSLQKAASFGKQLAEDNHALRQQIQQLQAQLEQASNISEANGVGSDVDQRRRLDTLSREHEELQQRAAGLESTCKELITRLESKESEVSSLESRVLEYSRRNEEIETQNRALLQKLKQSSALADQAVTMNDELENLRAKLAEAQANEQTQNRLVTSLQERLSTYQSQYEDSTSKSATETEQLLKQVEKLNAELSAKNSKIQRLESFQTTAEELQQQSGELVETINSLKEENQLLQRQIEVKDTVIAQQKARALSLLASAGNSGTAQGPSSDAVATTPSRRANLGSLLQTTPTHSRNPSTGSTTPMSNASNGNNGNNTQSSEEAQLLLKQQQDQLNSMQAQLE